MFASLNSRAITSADVAIVGAGPVGITLALCLARAGQRVVLLEAGDRQPSEAATDRYRGTLTGRTITPPHVSRVSAFGGSSNHWGGWLADLQPEDLAARADLGRAAWPLTHAALAPWVRQACELLGAQPFPVALAAAVDLNAARLTQRCYQLALPPPRFGARHLTEVRALPDLHAVTGATVVELTRQQGNITGLVVAGRAAQRRIRAPRVVLAAGGLENARLLLTNGLGGAATGRFFMEHLHATVAEVRWLGPPELLRGLSLRQHRPLPVLPSIHPPPLWQQRQGIGQVSLYLEPGGGSLWLKAHGEQQPNAVSRVTLADEHDTFGIPRLALHWQLLPPDLAALRSVTLTAAQELGRLDLARLRPADWIVDTTRDAELDGGGHHMGTTRMHTDPALGCTDGWGQVHGTAGLYCAGTSLFTSGGAANPTLTALALTLRQAEHLAG